LEQRQATEATGIDAVILIVEKASAEGRLGPMREQDVALSRTKFRLKPGAFQGARRGEVKAGG
jgi:predicted nuclease with RNAse H fold